MAASIKVENIHKNFGSRKVLRDITFELSSPGSIGVTGHNGSGKSTLMKILAQIIPQSKGSVSISLDEKALSRDRHFEAIKMVAPEMALYEMLTAYENLSFFATLSDKKLTRNEQDYLLNLVGLSGRGGDFVGEYSSGMKQRLKYAVAMLANPEILILDEPTANLDDDGKAIVEGIIKRQLAEKILIIATNETEDLEHVASVIRLDD